MDTPQYDNLVSLLHRLLDKQAATQEEQQKTIQALETRLKDLSTENAYMRQQLDFRDVLLAAKEEMLSLLRAGHNRPN